MLDFEQLEKYAKQIDYHIHSLTDMMDVMREMKTAIQMQLSWQQAAYRSELTAIKENYLGLCRQLEQIGLPKIDIYELQMTHIREKLFSDEWPQAVAPDFLLQTPEAYEERAGQILDFVVTDYFEGARFLDYGCGNGYVARAAAKRGTTMSVGYDVKKQWAFESSEHLTFTTELQEVKDLGPYDIILLFDVLDHVEGAPASILKEVQHLLSDKGRVYVRCHPWCSRHGGHLYEKLNKAYAHLVLDDIELTRLGGLNGPPVPQKVVRPLPTYRKWFEEAGLVVKSESPITDEMEDFFLADQVVRERIERNWNGEVPMAYASVSLVDYVLESAVSGQKIY